MTSESRDIVENHADVADQLIAAIKEGAGALAEHALTEIMYLRQARYASGNALAAKEDELTSLRQACRRYGQGDREDEDGVSHQGE